MKYDQTPIWLKKRERLFEHQVVKILLAIIKYDDDEYIGFRVSTLKIGLD